MLQRLRHLAGEGQSFAFESTLASRSFASWIATIQQTGYRLSLVYVWLPSAEVALARVQQRVRQGGHSIPADTVRRRYGRSIANFFRLYRPLANDWRIFDNASSGGPRLIAEGGKDVREQVHLAEVWAEVLRGQADDEGNPEIDPGIDEG
jgi:predicted ABC-type ATPase